MVVSEWQARQSVAWAWRLRAGRASASARIAAVPMLPARVRLVRARLVREITLIVAASSILPPAFPGKNMNAITESRRSCCGLRAVELNEFAEFAPK
jgi:hypothetical protein